VAESSDENEPNRRMKHCPTLIAVFGLLFLFFIQSAGTLVESIYILDLLHTRLDEKILGVLFFFTPLLALPFYKEHAHRLSWILFGLLFVSRGLTPYLNTPHRVTASGIAAGATLSLLFLILAARRKGKAQAEFAQSGATGLALAVNLSVLLRAAGDGVEYSLTPAGGWAGWLAGLLLGWMLTQLDFEHRSSARLSSGTVTAPLLGIYLIV
jgi:hypothetical protein